MLHQHRLALPRAADDDVGLAPLDVQVDPAQNVLRAEALVQTANPDLPAIVAGGAAVSSSTVHAVGRNHVHDLDRGSSRAPGPKPSSDTTAASWHSPTSLAPPRTLKP